MSSAKWFLLSVFLSVLGHCLNLVKFGFLTSVGYLKDPCPSIPGFIGSSEGRVFSLATTETVLE